MTFYVNRLKKTFANWSGFQPHKMLDSFMNIQAIRGFNAQGITRCVLMQLSEKWKYT